MTYILKSNFGSRDGQSRKKILLYLIVSAAVAVGSFYFLGRPMGNTASKLLAPVLFARNIVGDLITQNKNLRQQVSDLQAQLSYQVDSVPEVASLQLPGAITSYVLSLPPRTPYDTIIIDKGSDDGIAKNDLVFISPSVQIGTIESIFSNTAQLKLFSYAGTKTAVVSARTGESIEIEGRGGGNFFVELPLDFDVQKEDLFILPGEKRIVIAQVGNIERDEGDSFLQVLLVTPVKIKGDSVLYVQH